jgi:hypothetical protein
VRFDWSTRNQYSKRERTISSLVVITILESPTGEQPEREAVGTAGM